MLFSVLLRYWYSELRDLPLHDNDLFCVMGGQRPTYRKHKETILRVFNDIKPELDQYYAWRVTRKTTLEIMAREGRAKIRQLRLLEQRPKNLDPTLLIPDANPLRKETGPEPGERKKMTPRR